jgi:hypothetical protein
MLSSAYQQALNKIEASMRTRIEAGVLALDAQLQANIHNETALAVADFVSVLELFASNMATDPDLGALSSWTKACRAHPLKGNIVPEPHLPIVLGRCKTLNIHADDLVASEGADFDVVEARRLLRKYAESSSLPSFFIDALRKTVLGKHTLWATFDASDSKRNPFFRLPQTHAGICAALGLDHSEPIIVLAWRHQEAGAKPLHRPTIADAAAFTLFRPYHDPASHFGYTGPLAHTPALEPQPEVVLESIKCEGLILPYMVFVV